MKIGEDDGGKRGFISKMLLLTMMTRVNNQYQHYLLYIIYYNKQNQICITTVKRKSS